MKDGNLKKTSDYGKFQLLEFNRDVKKLNQLRANMKKVGWKKAFPMWVVRKHGNLRIKDGHHRFIVAQELGIPVLYVIDDDDLTMYEINGSVNIWNMGDFTTSNAREGYHDYDVVSQYHEKTGIPLKCCAQLLGGGSFDTRTFKEGGFEVKTVDHANAVGLIVQTLREKCRAKWATNSNFVTALSNALKSKEVSSRVMKKQLVKYHYLVESMPSISTFQNEIERIYNRGSRTKIPVAFYARESARQRSMKALYEYNERNRNRAA